MKGTSRLSVAVVALAGACALPAGAVAVPPPSHTGLPRVSLGAAALERGGADSAAPAAPPIDSTGRAGWITSQTTGTTVATSFKVPKPTCTSTDSGVAPVAWIDDESIDVAGVLVQCTSGAVVVTPTLVADGVETNFVNPVKAGDAMQATVSVGAGGSSVTLKDLTAARAFTLNETGADSAPIDEFVGTAAVFSGGLQLPAAPISSAHFTSTTLGGAAMGTLSLTKVVWVDGCATVLAAGSFDSTTHEVFSVRPPVINITDINPLTAPTGTALTVTGTGFNSGSTVTFKGGTATSVSHISSTELQATVPPNALSGPITVKNTTTPTGSISSGCSFTVQPTITSFTPSSGITGSTVTINGSGFKPTTKVLFGSKSAKFTVASAQKLSATVPSGSVAAPITVQAPGGSAMTATSFTPTLSITSFGPTSGPFGTVVTINGIGFTNTSTVAFHGTAASAVTFLSSTKLKATVPQSATTGPVTVTNSFGTVRSGSNYTVTPHVAPTVTSFTPTSGPVGTSVTITGTNFSGASAVKFGTVKAKYKIVSATSITATAPTGVVTAPISVTTAAGTGTSSSSFTVTCAAAAGACSA